MTLLLFSKVSMNFRVCYLRVSTNYSSLLHGSFQQCTWKQFLSFRLFLNKGHLKLMDTSSSSMTQMNTHMVGNLDGCMESQISIMNKTVKLYNNMMLKYKFSCPLTFWVVQEICKVHDLYSQFIYSVNESIWLYVFTYITCIYMNRNLCYAFKLGKTNLSKRRKWLTDADLVKPCLI